MSKASVIKAEVVHDSAKGMVLLGTAECKDELINFKAAYQWPTIDEKGFISDLTEQLAEGFGVKASDVDVMGSSLLKKMGSGHFEAVLKGVLE